MLSFPKVYLVFKPVFFLCQLFLLFILINSPFIYAQKYPDRAADSLLNSGINLIVSQDYDSAEKIFAELKFKYPEIPFGDIYSAANEIAKSYDLESCYAEERISTNLETALTKSEILLKKNDKNIWNVYLFALSKGYFAYYKALTKNWLSAVSNGYDSYESFEKCLAIDSLFFDAYTAIGNFKYWKSSSTDFLTWLPFVDDESEMGIEYLEKAVEHPSYNTYLAIHSLQWIYINQKEYKKAVELSKTALKKYPGSRFFMWGLARAYEEIDKRKAVKIYYEILNSYSEIIKLSSFHEILLKHLIAQQYEKLGEREKALALCNEILLVDFSSSSNKEKIEKRVEKVKDLKNKILVEKKNLTN